MARWGGHSRRAAVGAAVAVALASLGGCGSPRYLHANLTDAEIRSRLDADFAPGMTREEVEARLDERGVTERYRRFYPAREAPARPAVLLVRLFEPGGLWSPSEIQWHQWVDAMFVFGGGARLERVETVRTEEQFFRGRAVHRRRSPELPPDEPPLPGWGGAEGER